MSIAIQNVTTQQTGAARVETHSHVCTLFEGAYHLGLAALTNSLVANGFRGTIWAGYRGALPPWSEGSRHVVTEDVVLEFVPLTTNIHLTNYKPQFMLDLIRGGKVDTGYLWYFDPDIVVDAAWSFFLEWSEFGVCLAEDVNNDLSDDHPIRMMWKKLGKRVGCTEPRRTDRYINAGFIGVPCSATETLEIWQEFIRLAGDMGTSLVGFLPGSRTEPFCAPDQDGLNAALMYDSAPHSTVGREAMAFTPGWHIMPHAIGRPKPWEGCRLVGAFGGRAPNLPDKVFYKYCRGPIPIFSGFELRMRKLDLLIASAMGRIYRRG